MKKADVQGFITITADCPYCNEEIDMLEQDYDGRYCDKLLEGKDISGITEMCPHCEKDFVIGENVLEPG